MTIFTIILTVVLIINLIKDYREKRAIRATLKMLLERQIKHELLLLTVCDDDQIKTVFGDSTNDR